MALGISQAAAVTGLSAHTLRYYEKEGLLPRVGRDATGNRVFTDGDLENLLLIRCLKETGMSIKEIRAFFAEQKDTGAMLRTRLAVLIRQQEHVLAKIAAFQKNRKLIGDKLAYYQQACVAHDSGEPVPVCSLCALRKNKMRQILHSNK